MQITNIRKCSVFFQFYLLFNINKNSNVLFNKYFITTPQLEPSQMYWRVFTLNKKRYSQWVSTIVNFRCWEENLTVPRVAGCGFIWFSNGLEKYNSTA